MTPEIWGGQGRFGADGERRERFGGVGSLTLVDQGVDARPEPGRQVVFLVLDGPGEGVGQIGDLTLGRSHLLGLRRPLAHLQERVLHLVDHVAIAPVHHAIGPPHRQARTTVADVAIEVVAIVVGVLHPAHAG